MTFGRTPTGSRAHIWDPDSLPQERALCGVDAPIPYTAADEDLRAAERDLCETCEAIRRARHRRQGHL